MKAAAASFLRRNAEAVAFLCLYCALFLTWNALGGSFRVWPDLWQLLPWPALLADLGGSLLDLHSQPPFLNLLFGIALKIAVTLGSQLEPLLQPLYFLAGAATVVATTVTAQRVVPSPRVRGALLLLFLLNPYLYSSLHYFFYTPWELLFLSLCALLGLRHFERPSAARLSAALAPAVLLVYTRSLFHPLWFAVFLVLLLMLGKLSGAERWKALVVAVAAVVLVAAWPLKNLARFGFFGYSSWSGMSIARGLPTGEPVVASSYPLRLAAFARPSNQPLDAVAAARAESLLPPQFRNRPTLAALEKPDGSPNWNHYALIPLSQEIGKDAMKQVRKDPTLLLAKAVDFYLNGYAVYEARWPYETGFSPEMTVGHGWARAYEAVVFQRFRPYDPSLTRATTGFAILFPLGLTAVGLALWCKRPWRSTECTVALMTWTVLWVLALVLFVDGPEGNRVRFSTWPYLLVAIGWAAWVGWDLLRSVKSRTVS